MVAKKKASATFERSDDAEAVWKAVGKATSDRIAAMHPRQKEVFFAEAAQCIRRLAQGRPFNCQAMWIFQAQEPLRFPEPQAPSPAPQAQAPKRRPPARRS